MKRKFLVLVCIAALVCSLLSACSLTQAKTITFAKQPQSVFVLNDTVNINDLLEVNVVLTDGSTRSDVPVTVNNFSTDKLGVFTATVSYRGASVQFTYYVVESLDGKFLGGNGTAENPYLIANAEQFMNIRSFDYIASVENLQIKHFKLLSDIDFSDSDIASQYIKNYGSLIMCTNMIGSGGGVVNILNLDGNGYTIKGVPNNGETSYIFFNAYASTIRNLTLEVDGSVCLIYAAGSLSGLEDVPNVLENVTVTGSKSSEGDVQANLVERVFSNTEVVFKNCANNAAMRTTSTYAAPFVGKVNSGATLTFENCANNAIIEGQHAGAFVAQASGGVNVNFTDCANNGSVFGTEAAGVIGSTNQKFDGVEAGICRNPAPVEGLLAFNEQGELYIDLSALEGDSAEVGSFKVQMQFRVAYWYGDSQWRKSALETVSKYYIPSGTDILTGFMNWDIYSKFGDIEDLASYYKEEYGQEGIIEGGILPPEAPAGDVYEDGAYCKSGTNIGTGGNYVTAEVEGETCYYFTDEQDNFPHYYVVYDGAWITYTVFAYDINGNLLFSSVPVTTSQAAPV